jgi:hypothetical protein
MYPSAALCRAQQALQLNRAAAATLGNVRSIAEKAAAAWGVEARLADDRERRQAKTVRLRHAREQASREFSENPDRGFADD